MDRPEDMFPQYMAKRPKATPKDMLGQVPTQISSFFKESTKCRKPNLNADNFRDALFQSRVIERQKIATDEDLVNYLLHKNAELAERTDDEWAASAVGGGKALMNQIKKARDEGQGQQ